jgi:peptidoglycan-associated lipoprotein
MKAWKVSRLFLSVGVLAVLATLTACHSKRPADTTPYTPAPAHGMKTVYYDYDQAIIRSDQMTALSNNGNLLRDKPSLHVVIEGHCDERGTNEYNLALGDRRARSAKNYLVNLGLDPNRMKTVSYGEERPACTQSDESCWWQNRRAEFLKD